MRRLTGTLDRRSVVALLGAQLGLMATGAAAGNSAKTHVVTIKRFEFLPETLEIKVGDTVEWVNEDAAPHTATHADYDWDTEELKKGETARITFDQPGTHDYFCIYHPHMKAVLNVIT